MLVRLPLLPPTKRFPYYTVEAPTFKLVEADFVHMTALVEVPDDDVPPVERVRAELELDATRPGGRRRWPRAAELDAWHRHLDGRYVEHAGRFRPIPI